MSAFPSGQCKEDRLDWPVAKLPTESTFELKTVSPDAAEEKPTHQIHSLNSPTRRERVPLVSFGLYCVYLCVVLLFHTTQESREASMSAGTA